MSRSSSCTSGCSEFMNRPRHLPRLADDVHGNPMRRVLIWLLTSILLANLLSRAWSHCQSLVISLALFLNQLISDNLTFTPGPFWSIFIGWIFRHLRPQLKVTGKMPREPAFTPAFVMQPEMAIRLEPLLCHTSLGVRLEAVGRSFGTRRIRTLKQTATSILGQRLRR